MRGSSVLLRYSCHSPRLTPATAQRAQLLTPQPFNTASTLLHRNAVLESTAHLSRCSRGRILPEPPHALPPPHSYLSTRTPWPQPTCPDQDASIGGHRTRDAAKGRSCLGNGLRPDNILLRQLSCRPAKHMQDAACCSGSRLYVATSPSQLAKVAMRTVARETSSRSSLDQSARNRRTSALPPSWSGVVHCGTRIGLSTRMRLKLSQGRSSKVLAKDDFSF